MDLPKVEFRGVFIPQGLKLNLKIQILSTIIIQSCMKISISSVHSLLVGKLAVSVGFGVDIL